MSVKLSNGVLLLCFFCALAFMGSTASAADFDASCSNGTYYWDTDGECNITASLGCENSGIYLNNNVTVNDSAALTLRNVTLYTNQSANNEMGLAVAAGSLANLTNVSLSYTGTGYQYKIGIYGNFTTADFDDYAFAKTRLYYYGNANSTHLRLRLDASADSAIYHYHNSTTRYISTSIPNDCSGVFTYVQFNHNSTAIFENSSYCPSSGSQSFSFYTSCDGCTVTGLSPYASSVYVGSWLNTNDNATIRGFWAMPSTMSWVYAPSEEVLFREFPSCVYSDTGTNSLGSSHVYKVYVDGTYETNVTTNSEGCVNFTVGVNSTWNRTINLYVDDVPMKNISFLEDTTDTDNTGRYVGIVIENFSDTVPPTLSIVSPANQSTHNSGTTSLMINISSSENAICKYSLSNAGFNYSATGTLYTSTGSQGHSFNYSALTSGNTYVVYTKCNDSVGNINPGSLMHSFSINEVETNPPAVSAVYPLNNAMLRNKTINFLCNATDAEGHLYNISFWWNEPGTWTQDSSNATPSDGIPWNFTRTIGSDEEFSWLCRACDSEGNCANSSAKALEVDSTSPTVTIITPTSGTYQTSPVSVTSTSADSHLDECWYYTNVSGDNTTYPCNNDISLDVLDGQSYLLVLYANDTFGNVASDSVSFSVDIPQLQIAGVYPEGASFAVWMTDNYVFAASGALIKAYNITDSASFSTLDSNTVPTWTYDTQGVIWSIEADNNTVYVANENKVLLINYTNPANPVLLDSWSNGDANDRLTVSGNYVYVANELSGLVILNATNKSDLSVAGTVDSDSIGSMHYDNDIVFMGGSSKNSNQKTLYIFNVSDKAHPVSVSNWTGWSSADPISDMHSNGDVMYLVKYYQGLYSLNISNLSDIRVISYYNITNRYASSYIRVYYHNGIAYLSVRYHSLLLLNVSDPANMNLLFQASQNYAEYFEDVAMAKDGNYACVCSETGGVSCFNVTTKSGSWTRVSLMHFSNEIYNMIYVDDRVYISPRNDDLFTINVSNKSAPVAVHVTRNVGRYGGSDYSGDVLAVCGAYSSVNLYNISNRDEPIVTKSDWTGGDCGDAEIDDYQSDILYFGNSAYEGRFTVANISNISKPVLITYIPNMSSIEAIDQISEDVAIAVSGESAAVDSFTGISFINISNKTNPRIIGNYSEDYNTFYQSTTTPVYGDYLFLTAKGNCIRSFDISNYSNIQPVDSLCYPGTWAPEECAIKAPYLYCTGTSGVRVIDISDPADLTLVESFSGSNLYGTSTGKAFIAGNYLYISNGFTGFVIFELSDQSPPSISITSPYNNEVLSYGTSSTEVVIATNEAATCKHSTSSSFNFSTGGTLFTSTGGRTHSFTYTGLSNGASVTLYHKCNDSSGNINTQSTSHSFSVSSVNTPPSIAMNESISDVNVIIERNYAYFEAYSNETLLACNLQFNGTNYTATVDGAICYRNMTDLPYGNYTSVLMHATNTYANRNSTGTYWVFINSTESSTTTSTTTTTVPGPCVLPGNYEPCGTVSLSEVVDYIREWVADEAALSDVVNLIHAWVDGTGS